MRSPSLVFAVHDAQELPPGLARKGLMKGVGLEWDKAMKLIGIEVSEMRQITVQYHREDGVWRAESLSLPGFSSVADSLDELRILTREGVATYLNDEPHMILETALP